MSQVAQNRVTFSCPQKGNEMITDILKMIAPGTPIRDGLENILKAKTGALIVIGDSKEVLDLVDGGFQLNIDYTSSRLYELAKRSKNCKPPFSVLFSIKITVLRFRQTKLPGVYPSKC